MKPLSEIYKELGIAFTFPIDIEDANGYPAYYELSDGFWQKWEHDAVGNRTYFENSEGYKIGTHKAAIILDEEESIRFAEMLEEEPSQPPPEMQRAIQAYRDSGIELRKDKERLDWLIDNNCEIYEPDTALLYCDCDRESIDEMMNDESETKPEERS